MTIGTPIFSPDPAQYDDPTGRADRICRFVSRLQLWEGLTVWPPKLEGADAARRSVGIADEQLRSVMVRQAQASYRALGGTDGEWIKTWDEEKRDEADEGKGLRRFLSNGAE